MFTYFQLVASSSKVLALLQPMEVKYTLEHQSSVDCCRFVGDYGSKKATRLEGRDPKVKWSFSGGLGHGVINATPI